MNSLRNPSALVLVAVAVLAVVPLFWPVTLYVWLRFLTGHRGGSGAPVATEPVVWGNEAPR